MNKICGLIAGLESPEQVKEFLEIVLTEKEIEMMQERMEIFHNLYKGHSQRKTAENTGAGIATVTRGAKAYKRNKALVDHYLTSHYD